MGMFGGQGGGGAGASTGMSAESMSNMNKAKSAGSQFGGMNNKKNGFGSFVDKYGSAFAGMANGGYVSNEMTDDDKNQQIKNQATQGLNNVPIVGMFKGIGDAMEGIGGALGGAQGANAVQGFTDPLGRQIEVLKSKDYSQGQKVASMLLPFISGFMKPSTERKDNREAKMDTLVNAQTEKMRDNRFFKEKLASEGSYGSQYTP